MKFKYIAKLFCFDIVHYRHNVDIKLAWVGHHVSRKSCLEHVHYVHIADITLAWRMYFGVRVSD